MCESVCARARVCVCAFECVCELAIECERAIVASRWTKDKTKSMQHLTVPIGHNDITAERAQRAEGARCAEEAQ